MTEFLAPTETVGENESKVEPTDGDQVSSEEALGLTEPLELPFDVHARRVDLFICVVCMLSVTFAFILALLLLLRTDVGSSISDVTNIIAALITVGAAALAYLTVRHRARDRADGGS
ncbi:MAG: hypothetical protein JJU45_15245 [Acidimicrobiia bacterium]|nr:hypothetical protein [Acidimicrobiia bacterium]